MALVKENGQKRIEGIGAASEINFGWLIKR